MKGRRHDATGRSTDRLKSKDRLSIKGGWVPHRHEMIEHRAFQALTLVARRILDRLEIEHCAHAGEENGNLVVTYQDLVRFGLRKKSIASGLAELVELGFVEIVSRGRAAAYEYRRASVYRLTFIKTRSTPPTDEWRALTDEQVASIANRIAASRRAPAHQDLDSRGISAPETVVANSPPRTVLGGGENAPESRAKTPPAFTAKDDFSSEKGAA